MSRILPDDYGYIRWNRGSADWYETLEQAQSGEFTRIDKIVNAYHAQQWWSAVEYYYYKKRIKENMEVWE